MLNSRFKKIFLMSAAVLVLMFCVFLIRLLEMIPSPDQVKNQLGLHASIKNPREISANKDKDDKDLHKTTLFEERVQNSTNSPSAGSKEFSKFILQEKEIDGDFCQNLEHVVRSRVDYGDLKTGNLFELMEEDLSDNYRSPALIALTRPLRYIATLKSVQDLISDLESQQEQVLSVSLTTKFYNQLLSAWYELHKEKNEINERFTMSYYMYMFTRALKMRPELIHHPQTAVQCQGISNLGGNLTNKRETLLELLRAANLRPEDIGLESTKKADFALSLTRERGLELSIRWPTLQ